MANLKDIASLVDVSVSTVSRVLNNDHSLVVSDETRSNILMAAKQLNYKAKKTGRGIKIAIINWYNHEQEIIDPYYYYIRSSAQKECEKLGIESKIVFSHEEIENLHDISGIIAIGKFSDYEIEKMNLYTNNIVFADSCPDELKYDSIVNNFREVMFSVVEMFHKDGFTDIGYIGGKEKVKDGSIIIDPRHTYFVEKLEELGLYKSKYVFQGEFNADSGYNNMKKLIEVKSDKQMAVFCANDIIALGVTKAILEAGYEIPKDFALVGFNDVPIANFIHPSLTTVHAHMSEIGLEAVSMLTNRIKNPDAIYKKIIIPTKMVYRDSYLRKEQQ